MTALIAAIGVIGGGATTAVLNSADLMEMVTGKGKAEQTAIQIAEQRAEKSAADMQKLAAEQNDLTAWATALELNTADSYDFYLRTQPQGAHRSQAELAMASAQQRPIGAFLVDQLHPTLRQTVNAARTASTDANVKQSEAESVARRAAAAALQAQARPSPRGFASFRNPQKDLYEGEGGPNRADGVGVYIEGDAPHTGDKYQGQLAGGRWQGLGVYESATPNPLKPARYAGEFVSGHQSGLGVVVRADGVRQAGVVLDGRLNGPGVETRTDGSLLEGEFRDGLAHGLAVLWSPSGAVIDAGRFDQGVLVQRF